MKVDHGEPDKGQSPSETLGGVINPFVLPWKGGNRGYEGA